MAAVISLIRVIKFAFQDFWRNFWLSVVTISVLVLTLVTVNLLISVQVITQKAIETVQGKMDLLIDFKVNTPEEQIQKLKGDLEKMSEVESVAYMSEDEVLAQFVAAHADDQTLVTAVEDLEENPLGAVLVVKARDAKYYDVIFEFLNKEEYQTWIKNKDYQDNKEIIAKINDVTDKVRQVGQVLIAILAGIAVLIVFNTIRVAIYTHRGEISIMKSVGAANWFVRLPFLITSILYGILALVLTIGFWYPVLGYIQPHLNTFFGTEFNIISYFNQFFWQIFGLELVGAVLLNIISSSVAVGRYLNK